MQPLRSPARSALRASTRSHITPTQSQLNRRFISSSAPRTLATSANSSFPLRATQHIRPLAPQNRPAYSKSFHNSTPKMASKVQLIKSKKEFMDALNADGVMVLDCFAEWCGPCKVIAPKIDEFSKKYENARFYKVDVDEVPDVAQELNIRAMPTFLFFKGGEKINEVVGAQPAAIEQGITSSLEKE